MTTLFFDIETLPVTNKATIERITKEIKAPTNYTSPDAIAKYIEGKKQAIIAETSLNGAYGSIACIGWKHGDDCKIYTTSAYMTEREVITDFYNNLENTSSFCGHNIINFDLPFLKHRSMVLGIKPPSIIMNAINAKVWESIIKDTMYVWTGSMSKFISLDTLCWIFDIDGKGDFNGSMVADTWYKDPQKVLDYCAGDVQRTYEVYQRMMFADKVF